jgi:hypothetical protein
MAPLIGVIFLCGVTKLLMALVTRPIAAEKLWNPDAL